MKSSADLGQLALSLSSSAAQTWAAFLIFYILLIRDMEQEKKRRIRELWTEFKILWGGLIQDFRGPMKELLEKHPEWELSFAMIHRSSTDVHTFRRIIKSISDYRIVLTLERECEAARGDLLPEQLQQSLEPLALELQLIERERASPLNGLRIGLAATAANSFLMIFPAYSPVTPTILHGLISAQIIMNFVCGCLFYQHIRSALETIREVGGGGPR